MKNYIQEGDDITVMAPGAVASGDGVLIGTALFGVAKGAAGAGEPVVIKTDGVFNLPAGTVAAGDPVEWDGSAVQTVSSGTRIGVALAADANGYAEVLVG